MTKIVEEKISYQITGLCFKIHNELGRFCREKQYAEKLEELLKEKGIPYLREANILKEIADQSPDGNIVDFIIENKVIVDLKAKKFITKDDYIQMQRYLRAAEKELGLIINFRSTFLKPKRVLNSKLLSPYSDHSDRHS